MPEPPKRTCVRIEYEYSDGEIRRAVGDAAEEINGAIADAFLMKQVHGERYRGPVMQVVRPADEPRTSDPRRRTSYDTERTMPGQEPPNV